MPTLTIRHLTTYHYRRPVAFGEHRMMLRPRDDDHQKVLETAIEITPKPIRLAWTRDAFGNHVASGCFADLASELRFECTIRLEHAPAGFRADDIEEFARTYPFAYAVQDQPDLARYIACVWRDPRLARWAKGFLPADGSADTRELLCDMTRTIHRTFRHVARHQHGTQGPMRTLGLSSGSCRDLAVLMIAALRSLGIAARFESGYRIAGGNTHAWVQAYVPGPGWVEFDPSRGMVGNENLVRVAVVRDPREAIPLQGVWFGNASDHLAMKVAVKVSAAAA